MILQLRRPALAFGTLVTLCAGIAQAQVPQAFTDCSSATPAVAIQACSSIINDGRQTQRNKARAYYLRGRAHGKNQAHDIAIADFDAAIRIDQGHAGAFAARAVAHGQKGNFERSIQDASEAIRLEPSNGAGYAIRGESYLRRCDFPTALSDFETAIRLNPDLPNAYLGRGSIHMRNGETNRALEDAEQAVRLQPDSATSLIARGSAHAKLNHLDTALQDFDRAILIKADYAPAYHNRGLIFARRGELDRAIQDFDAAIRLKADYLSALVNRAKALQQQGAKERALSDLNRALQIKRSCDEDPRIREDAQWRIAALKAEVNSPPPLPSPPPLRDPPQSVEPPRQPEQAKGRATRRVALVIGNSSYTNDARLNNPARDSKAVAAILRKLGFAEVIERYDLGVQQLGAELKAFGDKAASADWAVVYYAGHGIQVDGQTYLVPTDANLARASHAADEAVPLDRVLAKVADARQMRLVILDACRTNPFLSRMAQSGGSRSLGRGLARVENTGGVLVAYAARDGQIADDGTDEHSPFTKALLEHIEQPGLEIGLLFRKVRDTVLKRTGGAQEPYTYGSIPSEEMFFRSVQR